MRWRSLRCTRSASRLCRSTGSTGSTGSIGSIGSTCAVVRPGLAEGGFSVVELLIATALTAVVVSVGVELANPEATFSRTHAGRIEEQQRLRFATEVIRRTLAQAGAGMDSGPQTGSLAGFLPPLFPRRLGAEEADDPGSVRPDAITTITVPSTRAQSTLAEDLAGSQAVVDRGPGCPAAPACGFRPDMGLLMFDRTATFDLFTVRTVAGDRVSLDHRSSAPTPAYRTGAFLAQVDTRTFYFDAGARQIRQYNGLSTDAPLIDDVSAFDVALLADPRAPMSPKPDPGQPNCLYDASGTLLSSSAMLPVDDDGLARLVPERLSDGPWCGEGQTRFDADLLRVRRVRVTITLAAAGTPSSGITFDVALRNPGVR